MVLLLMMKKLILMLCLLPVLAVAQTNQTKTFNVNDGSFYAKERTNLTGTLSLETGFSAPLMRRGNLSAAVNLAYIQNLSNPWKGNGWESGLALGYRLNRGWSVYTKTVTNFNGNWNQETGLRTSIYRTSNYAVSASAGYVMDYPLRNKAKNSWNVGVTVSFPVKTLFK